MQVRYVEEYRVEVLLDGNHPEHSKITRLISEADAMKDDAETRGAGWARIMCRTVREEKRWRELRWQVTGLTRWTEYSEGTRFVSDFEFI